MIHIAAVGDVHYGDSSHPHFRKSWETLHHEADLLLLAGDLTKMGRLEEVRALCNDLEACRIPKIAVLGNHEYQLGNEVELTRELEASGIQVLNGSAVEIQVRNTRVGIVGMKGFGGGFMGACVSEFGEPEMKDFAKHSREQGELLMAALQSLTSEIRLALLHFSPIEETLVGEKREIFPFLGSYHLAEPLDHHQVDLAIHGHAHRGVEHGHTSGGVPVRNVAYPVIRAPYRVYSLEPKGHPVIKERTWASTMS